MSEEKLFPDYVDPGRYYWCKQCKDWHQPVSYRRNCEDEPPQRSELAAPMVIRDEMAPVQGQHDGKMYTSKRAIRRSYREHGMIEVGNDSSVVGPEPKAFPKVRPKREEVKASVEKALSMAGLGENPVVTGIRKSDRRVVKPKHT